MLFAVVLTGICLLVQSWGIQNHMDDEPLYGLKASKTWANFLSFFGPFGPIGPFVPYKIKYVTQYITSHILCKSVPNGPNGPNRSKKAVQILLAIQIHRNLQGVGLLILHQGQQATQKKHDNQNQWENQNQNLQQQHVSPAASATTAGSP